MTQVGQDTLGTRSTLNVGGKDYAYIPCLNDDAIWLQALANIARQHVQGWPLGAADPAQGAVSRQAALDKGASN